MATPVTNEQENKAVLSLALSFRPWPLSFNTNSGDSSCREPTPASTAQAGQCRRAPLRAFLIPRSWLSSQRSSPLAYPMSELSWARWALPGLCSLDTQDGLAWEWR